MSTRETNLFLCQMIVSNFQPLYSWKDVVSTIFFPVSRNEVGEEGTDIKTQALREKCPNTEFFLARVFPHRTGYIRTEYRQILQIFSPNAGKYGPEKTPYLDTCHAVKFTWIYDHKF